MAKMGLEERHSHSMSSVSMSMSSPGVPSYSYMQEMYWVFVFLFIGIAAAVHFFNLVLFRQRLVANARGDQTPAKPKSIIFQTQATITAIVREIAYCSWRPVILKKTAIYFPPFGPCILIGANLVLIIACWFYALNPENTKLWEQIGYRTFSGLYSTTWTNSR